MKTSVVNRRKTRKYDVYIGRGTPFGNPHVIGYCFICKTLHDRVGAVEAYKRDFYKRLTNPEFRDMVLSLKGKVLGCWCVPLLCHGNIIIEYLNTQ